ncbi:MAG: HAMP domain-containing sensor histidine kinase [Calothrix sp. MO_192.B10]|nr:HAMP domain-containing sensor histidine kinase [Calothrix sp. MO_192.B10]
MKFLQISQQILSQPEQEQTSQELSPFKKGFFWAARTRILLWYVAIIIFIFAVSVPVFRHLLYQRVDARVRRELVKKMLVFNKLIGNPSTYQPPDQEIANVLNQLDGRAKPPSSTKELKKFFNEFLRQQIVEDDTFLITFVNRKFFKSSPRARPPELQKDTELMQRWAEKTRPTTRKLEIPESEIGGIIYNTQTVMVDGKVLGVFVVAHTVAGEREEALEAIQTIIQVSGGVLVLAVILAWIASARVLAPLRVLSATTRSISESDLSKRIPVQGSGEIAELATTFNDMMNRLQVAFRTQRKFINDAGHELRTPITIIRGHLELMGDDPQERQETVDLVLDELDRMNRFVEDLILLAKAERPDFLQLETVDLTATTQELFAKAKALADRNWCLDAIAEGMIVLDRQRLTQAVMNLAQNATQHTQPEDTIAIGSSIDNNLVRFWVRDTGEGIAKSDRTKVFERFARATNSRRRSGGAGLGLSIVKAIAEAHNGGVKLQSELGQGSVFTIFIPWESSHLSN